MPLVDIHVIKGVFTGEQKQAMLAKVTEAMISVEGEKLRGVTWVKINEVEGGTWAIGGQPLQAADVLKLAEGCTPACAIGDQAAAQGLPHGAGFQLPVCEKERPSACVARLHAGSPCRQTGMGRYCCFGHNMALHAATSGMPLPR